LAPTEEVDVGTLLDPVIENYKQSGQKLTRFWLPLSATMDGRYLRSRSTPANIILVLPTDKKPVPSTEERVL
jgi:hypothetical protein